jgi:PST family polysaccharide transporter
VSDGEERLSNQAVKSTFWAYLSFVTGKALVFVSTIILARLLAPAEFGIVGFCLIAIQYLDVLNGLGVESALIARRDKVEQAANAAFALSIGSSLVLYILAWFAAPGIARFFDADDVTGLFRVLALGLLLNAAGSVPSAMIQRELRFKAKLVPDITSSILKGGTSIGFAVFGFGAWSLIWGQIAGGIMSAALFWILAGWRPTRLFDREVTKQVFGYGKHMIAIGIFGALVGNVDYLIVGRVLGAAALGYYTLAYRIPDLIVRSTVLVIAKVGFPFLSRLQSNPSELRSVYFKLLRYVTLFTFPAGVGLALIAPLFIRTFYTDRWEPSIVVMQFIAIAVAVTSVGYLPGLIYKSINRPEILTKIAAVRAILVVAVLVVAVRWGIAGVAFGTIVVELIAVALNTVIISRILQFPAWEMLRAITPALVASSAMALTVIAVMMTVKPDGLLGIVMLSVVGAMSYIAILAAISPDTTNQTRTMLRSTLGRS